VEKEWQRKHMAARLAAEAGRAAQEEASVTATGYTAGDAANDPAQHGQGTGGTPEALDASTEQAGGEESVAEAEGEPTGRERSATEPPQMETPVEEVVVSAAEQGSEETLGGHVAAPEAAAKATRLDAGPDARAESGAEGVKVSGAGEAEPST
jgi:hypothetical protein